jgi:hypothetical protein
MYTFYDPVFLRMREEGRLMMGCVGGTREIEAAQGGGHNYTKLIIEAKKKWKISCLK